MRWRSMARRALTTALALVMLLASSAAAEARLVRQEYVSGLAGLHTVNNSYVLRLSGAEEQQYAVFGRNGERLSDAYDQIEVRQDHRYYIVSRGNDMNARGLVDGSGQEVIPPLYGRIDVVGDRWILACVLESWDRIALTDVFFNGVKIGTLSAEDYTMSSYASAHGAYLGLSGGQAGFYVNSRFERVDGTADYFVTDEYFYNWEDGRVYHPASGQQAFVPGCTLSEADVEQAVWYNDDGDFVNLQGQVVYGGPFVGREYVSVEYEGGAYLRVRDINGINIADRQGVELFPVMFHALGGDTRSYFATEYQAALHDGRLFWIDRGGNVMAAASFSLNEGDYQGFSVNGLFAVVRAQGEAVIITATAGELPQRYEDATPPTSPRQRILSVKQGGRWGAIDTDGRTVIPFEHEGPLQISDDGTLAVGQTAQQGQVIYTVAYGDEEAYVPAQTTAPVETPVPTEAPVMEETPTQAPPPPESAQPQEEWACPTCGRINNLNFCPKDGTARPVAPPSCAQCGYVSEEDEEINFCPNCGAVFQAA